MKAKRYSTTFDLLPLNQRFTSGGTVWIKKSSRTAFPVEAKNRTFYFSKSEYVVFSRTN